MYDSGGGIVNETADRHGERFPDGKTLLRSTTVVAAYFS
jgi:hypothetical protein